MHRYEQANAARMPHCLLPNNARIRWTTDYTSMKVKNLLLSEAKVLAAGRDGRVKLLAEVLVALILGKVKLCIT